VYLIVASEGQNIVFFPFPRVFHQVESNATYCSPRFAFQAGCQSSTMSLCEWYAKRVVLLTGVTSELGHALLEKILRCLPDVRVYVVLRSQNGLNGEERLKKIFASPGYERYPLRVPSRVHLVPVNRIGRSISSLCTLNCDRDSGRGRVPNLFQRTSN